jgi:hypothetical protein
VNGPPSPTARTAHSASPSHSSSPRTPTRPSTAPHTPSSSHRGVHASPAKTPSYVVVFCHVGISPCFCDPTFYYLCIQASYDWPPPLALYGVRHVLLLASSRLLGRFHPPRLHLTLLDLLPSFFTSFSRLCTLNSRSS